MGLISIQLVNPSPTMPLRLSTEDRITDFASEAEAARPVRPPDSVMTPDEHAEYMKRGSDIVFAKNGAGHDIQAPRWAANGFSSLAEYCTFRFQETLRPAYPPPERRGVRVLNDWREPVVVATVPPGGKTQLTITDNRRIVADCASTDDVGLRVENTDLRQTIRLRSRRLKGGAEEHVSFLAANGNNCGAVNLNKSTAAVIELMPS